MSKFTPHPNCIPLPMKRRKDKTEEATLPTTDYWINLDREWFTALRQVETINIEWVRADAPVYKRAIQQHVHNTANPPIIRTGYRNKKEAVGRMIEQQEEQRIKANNYYRQVFGKVNVNND